MRMRGIKLLGLIAAGGGIAAFTVLRALPGGDPQAAQSPAPWTSTGVFTTAHRTALEAMREFFLRHPVPVQPIAFTHKVHLANGMECVNCHTGVDTGPDAQLPSVKLCMMCHQIIATDKPEIKKVAAYAARGQDIPWQRVYDFLPTAHLKFNHAPHIRAKVDCKVCHGDMTQQTVAVRKPGIDMGFCLDCHKQGGAPIDCTTCHF